ncbi:MAG: leucyl aminopeptidase, partial [Actinomycetales bacterium]|nr:leucyl aminopeptidase [Actinomycetales bacterium]
TDNKFDIVANGLPKAALTKIKSALSSVGATGGSEEIVKIPAGSLSSANAIVAVGLGSIKDGISEETLRRAAGAAIRSLAGVKRVSLALPASYAEAAGAILEGAALGAYSFTDHRHSSLNKQKSPVKSITLFADDARSGDFRAALNRARSVGTAVSFARNLINYSPLHLPPAQLAEEAKRHLSDAPIKVEVLDEKALVKGGFGGIMAVGQGSARPPRLIRMSYAPKGAVAHIALVGKGITFDTGGISLKPPASMHEMKADMSGAAAVVATIKAVAELGLPVQVTAYAACAENMPGGNAQRPGDVISIYGGRTVEVLNTDAEGRLVMADALVRAAEDKPDLVVDISTLTGAAVVALGFRTAGVLGDSDVQDSVMAAAERAGEPFWPMPMPAELRAPMESLVADIANIGQREGGMLSAGLFLKEFIAEGLSWGHLDIAGPAFNPGAPYGYTPKGGVGFGVRTLLALIEDLAADAE